MKYEAIFDGNNGINVSILGDDPDEYFDILFTPIFFDSLIFNHSIINTKFTSQHGF